MFDENTGSGFPGFLQNIFGSIGGGGQPNPNAVPAAASAPVPNPNTGNPVQMTPTSGLGPGVTPGAPTNLLAQGANSNGGLGILGNLLKRFGGGQPTQPGAVDPARAKQNQMAGINQIMGALKGPELKPASFAPLQLQNPGMQMPRMNLGDM